MIVVALLLGVSLIQKNKQAIEQKDQYETKVLDFSNNWSRTSKNYEDQKQVNIVLENDLKSRIAELEGFSNRLTQTSGQLTKVETEARNSSLALKSAQNELVRRDARIAELESQNQALDKQAKDLTNAINTLSVQISETQRKLATSEGDRNFLLKELKRLQAEKAELERQFNDLVILRDQVRKLKDALAISRRLDWIREGIYGRQGQKGAEALVAKPATGTSTNYGLDVELRQDGGVKVNPAPTNAAPAPPKK